jgi:hypothetical protein
VLASGFASGISLCYTLYPLLSTLHVPIQHSKIPNTASYFRPFGERRRVALSARDPDPVQNAGSATV